MKKESIARIQDLVGLLHALYPPQFAEAWDNVGLQIGDPAAAVTSAMVCLDPTQRALEAAAAAGAQALISHHPLIFQPLKNLVPHDETGRVLLRAAKEGISVLSAHTNLDRAPGGLNDWFAERFALQDVRPLATGGADLVKIVVFVPSGYEMDVADALFASGAGQIGRYDRCSFRTAGTGTFRPGPGTDPFLGREGETENAAEVRLETVVAREHLNRAVSRMIKAHPYEEVAYDLIPLANMRSDVGLGRIGRLPQPGSLEEFAGQVKKVLGCDGVRVVGPADKPVRKVALCGGSGASLIGEADRQGADVLVTGDIKYHEARNALSRGLALVDAGHFATERLMVHDLTQVLGREAEKRRLKISFVPMEGEADPFRIV